MSGLGNTGARAFRHEHTLITMEEYCTSILLIDRATKKSHCGKCAGTILRRCTGRRLRAIVEVVTGSVEGAMNQERTESIYSSRWVRRRTEALFLIVPR